MLTQQRLNLQVLFITITASLLAGCAGTPPDAQASPSPSASLPPAPAPVVPSAAPIEVDPTESSESVQARATGAVLVQDDLGAAWQPKELPMTDVGGGKLGQRTDNVACHDGLLSTVNNETTTGSSASGWSFDNGTALETVESYAFVYADDTVAQGSLIAYRSAAEQCHSWLSGGSDDGAYAFAHGLALFPVTVGEESFGLDGTVGVVSFPEVPLTHTYVIVGRTGDTVQVTSFLSTFPGAPGMSFVTEHAQTAASRVAAE